MFNPEIANTLPNGARIIERRRIPTGWVWLADFGGYMPYVTWVSNDCSPGDTYWGHYFLTYQEGYDDFIARIAKFGYHKFHSTDGVCSHSET